MRRPVRPFVTEYRGGTRRPSGQGHGPEIDLFKSEAGKSEPGAGGPVSWAPPTAPSQPEPPEDGYEAALRAADALFAGSRAAQHTPDDEASKPGSSGRVLRVLDEAPSPEMMRLEAEFAPKKRGRKPGSKNKPKLAALAAEAPVAPPTAMASEAPALPAVTSLAAVLTDAALARKPVTAAVIAASARKPATAALAAGPRGERYAWVRTRLKPGQQWKRRLPKVAW